MKMTKAEYLRQFKGINHYRGIDRRRMIDVPEPKPAQPVQVDAAQQAIAVQPVISEVYTQDIKRGPGRPRKEGE